MFLAYTICGRLNNIKAGLLVFYLYECSILHFVSHVHGLSHFILVIYDFLNFRFNLIILGFYFTYTVYECRLIRFFIWIVVRSFTCLLRATWRTGYGSSLTTQPSWPPFRWIVHQWVLLGRRRVGLALSFDISHHTMSRNNSVSTFRRLKCTAL